MRFPTIQTFNIDDLKLDEGNYRFRGAPDQRKCIEKIYFSNEKNFREMIKSLQDDDLGELLLVYVDENNQNVVMDGNRRLAALKVLNNPSLAPTDILNKAASKANLQNLDLSNIQAQVSNDKNLILRTVYERHSAGGGKSRVSWPALGRARFEYENESDELPENEWKLIALLFSLEKLDPLLSDYFDGKKYKHEVFKRIANKAIQMNIIPKSLFSERNKNIKVSNKKPIKKTYEICKLIFKDIDEEVIGLSRKPGSLYADSESVKRYLEKFISTRPEDDSSSQTLQNEYQNTTSTDEVTPTNLDELPPLNAEADNQQAPPNGDSFNSSESNGTNNSQDDLDQNTQQTKSSYGITYDRNVDQAVQNTNSEKIQQIYYSLYTISVSKHPAAITILCAVFYEVLAFEIGKDDDKTAIDNYLNTNKLESLFPNVYSAKEKKNFTGSFKKIREESNDVKHSSDYCPHNAKNIIVHMDRLKDLTIRMLNYISSTS